MKFEENGIYHIYNRGNQQQKIFFRRENYLFFLRKMQREIGPHCTLLAFCLMPNHFHFLIEVPEKSADVSGRTTLSRPTNDNRLLNRKIGTLLSSYTRAIQKQEIFTGSLFQQKTKSVEIKSEFQLLVCTNYIHNNPVKATLTSCMEDWEFSSFQEHCSSKRVTICDKRRLRNLLRFEEEDNFYTLSYQTLLDE